MKILFTTDLHGSTMVLKKAIQLAATLDVDLLLIGGDLSGKRLLPIIPDGSGYRAGEPYKEKDDTGRAIEKIEFEDISASTLTSFCSRLESKGYYWHVAGAKEIDELNESPEKLKHLFRTKIYDRIKEWAKLVNVKLPEGILCYWTGGNDDEKELISALLASDLGRFTFAEGSVMRIEDFEMISLGYSNITGFDTPRELAESELTKRLDSMLSRVSTTSRLILNVHVPPINCSNLDSVVGSNGALIHAGSEAVRAFVENVQPMAHFAGHVHEGKGAGLIGRTHVFNPGSDYNSGILQAFLVTCEGDEVIDYVHRIW